VSSSLSDLIEPGDVDHGAAVARGGDSYGHYWLFKCPKCGHPVMHDFEHDYFHPDISRLDRRISMASCGDSHPCPSCGHIFISDQLWDFAREHWSYPDWFLSRDGIGRLGLDSLIRKPQAISPPQTFSAPATSPPRRSVVRWIVWSGVAMLIMVKAVVFLYLTLR